MTGREEELSVFLFPQDIHYFSAALLDRRFRIIYNKHMEL